MNSCKTQFICPKCQSLIGEEKQEKYLECESCHTELSNESMLRSGSYFITFDIRYMINSLLKSEDVSECLYRNLLKRNANNQVFQQDICDGESYKTLGLQEFDFSLSLNTDGVSPFRSSKFSFWPILISLNELDYGLRRQNTLIVALWCGKQFASFCYAPMFIADSVARCAVQGLNQFNGKYGCPWCLIPGETHWCDDEYRSRKWVYRFQECVIRTQPQFLEDLDIFSRKLESRDFKEESYNVPTMKVHFILGDNCK
ncbi:unnamed protein product, partial [Allacma fusca]